MNCNHQRTTQDNCKHVYMYGDARDGDSALSLCPHCNKVFCEVCKKEWGEKEIVYVPYQNPWYVPVTPYITPQYPFNPVWTTITTGDTSKWTSTTTQNKLIQ